MLDLEATLDNDLVSVLDFPLMRLYTIHPPAFSRLDKNESVCGDCATLAKRLISNSSNSDSSFLSVKYDLNNLTALAFALDVFFGIKLAFL